MATGGLDQPIKDGHEVFYDWRCSKCGEDERMSEATTYCKNCNEGFCDSCLKSHNKFMKGHDVLGQRDKADWGEPVPSYDSGLPCSEHTGQTVSMYCGNHDEICCPVCAFMHHGEVCRPQMSYVPDAAKGFASKIEFGEFKAQADQLFALITRIENEKTECQSAVNASREQCRSDIAEIEEMVVERLADLKSASMSEINRIHDEEEHKMINDLDKCAEVKCKLNDIRQRMQPTVVVNEASLFVTTKYSKTKLQLYQEMCEELCKIRHKTYIFSRSPEIMQLSHSGSFGMCVPMEEYVDEVMIGNKPSYFRHMTISQYQQRIADEAADSRGKLSITIVKATLVKNYGLTRMDPYCRLRVGNCLHYTSTAIKAGRNPSWNMKLVCRLPHGVDTMGIEIFDEKSFGADDRVAWTNIELPAAVLNGEKVNGWFPLDGKQGEEKEGFIKIEFLLED